MPNEHVEMLNKFQPFDPDFKQIYFESAKFDLRIETKAFDTLKDAIRRPETRMVVLTGDAGHGKTHLCGLLLTELEGLSMPEAAELLKKDGFGTLDLAKCDGDRSLRVIRDLSEKRPEAAGETLRNAYELQDRVTVVCGNEGHLRACAQAAQLEDVQSLIDASVLKGHMRSDDKSVVLINLNHQSVVAEQNEPNIFEQVVEGWVSDDSKWASCLDCEHSEFCPILNNRDRLNENNEDGKKFRAQGVGTLLRIAEQTGSTVTIRQLLIYVAYLLTAGLDCDDVQELVQQNQGQKSRSWQWEYLFHNVAFGHRLLESQRRRLEVFSGIRKLDPGRRAIRGVDDRLGDSDDPFNGTFPPPYKAAIPGTGAPLTTAGRRAQARQHLQRWRAMRRFDFFEALGTKTGSGIVNPSERVGLSHIESYDRILDPNATRQELRTIRDRVVQGLEAIQGINRSAESKDMHIAHWAFSARSTNSTVVGASKKKSDIELLSQSQAWEARNGGESGLINRHVDWIERCVIVSLEGPNAPAESCIELMLHELEFVLAAAVGLRSEHFYAAQFRRIINALGRIPQRETENDEIIVYSDHERYEFLIEDGTVRLTSS